MNLTVAVITARAHPMLDRLADGLISMAAPADQVEILIVDFHERSPAALGVPELVSADGHATIRCRVVPPKPNPWQGPHRVTKRDLHAIANARNTAIVYARHDYLAFLDDRVTLGAGWLDEIRHGEATRCSAIAGAIYKTRDGGGIEDDHRRKDRPGAKAKGRTIFGASGGYLFGGNFSLPLEWLLAVNGHEEATDPIGCQDFVLGHMLVASGRRVDYVPSANVYLERSPRSAASPTGIEAEHPFPRLRGDRSMLSVLREKYGPNRRTVGTPDLTALRSLVQAGEPMPVPDRSAWPERFWLDGTRLEDM